jgi:hypothetical protein
MDPSIYNIFAHQQQPFLGQQFMQPTDPSSHSHHGGGFSPLMMISPFAGLMSQHPKLGLSMLSPGLGLASFLGAFK